MKDYLDFLSRGAGCFLDDGAATNAREGRKEVLMSHDPDPKDESETLLGITSQTADSRTHSGPRMPNFGNRNRTLLKPYKIGSDQSR